ncbi:hypothetical protein F5B20DRAFT_589869 [Whalleya microplaca]|nr:hypothetical protein F5B20DRAFT_589869 [Whalleya microplaca]
MSRLFGFRRVWPRNQTAVEPSIQYAALHLCLNGCYAKPNSIIAIHGLGTQSPRTWLAFENGNVDNRPQRSVNWLADDDMLPGYFPDSFIWTYDWDGDYCIDASVDTLMGQAQVFLRATKSEILGEQSTRPLLIIASCFGGIIAMKAVDIATRQSQFRCVLLSIVGIIFLASPLKGTGMKKALDWHILISTLMGKQVSDNLYRDLNARTYVLQDLVHFFTRCANGGWEPWYRIPLFCFYETKATQILKAVLGSWAKKIASGKRILVAYENATLDGVENEGLIANHVMMSKFRGRDDTNFQKVVIQLRKLIEDAPNLQAERSHDARFNVYSTLSSTVNPLFTGREEVIDRITHALREEDPGPGRRKVFVVVGEGGIGKSEICLHVAHKMQNDFWGIFWIDVSSRPMAESGYIAALAECKKTTRTLDEARKRLGRISEKWLLILDNADDVQIDYHAFLPPGKNGSVILTSRNPTCNHHQTVGLERITGLDDKHASELLFKAANVHKDDWSAESEDAARVAKLLFGHPLAIIQAGAYIKTFCRIREYPQIFQKRPQQQMAFELVQGQNRHANLHGAFEVSIEALEKFGPRNAQIARDLLGLLSMFHFTNLPLEIFESVSRGFQATSQHGQCLDDITPSMVSAMSPLFRVSNESDEYQNLREQAILTLESLALINIETQHGFKSLSMHPLVHLWVRNRFKSDSTERLDPRWLSAGTFLTLASRGTCRWVGWEIAMRPHLHSFLDLRPAIEICKEHQPTSAIVIFHCSRLLHQARDDNMVSSMLGVLFSIFDANQKSPTWELLPLYDLKAASDERCGLRSLAKELYEKIICLKEERLGNMNLDCLKSRHAMANTARGLGEVPMAISILEDVVQKRNCICHESDSDLLTSQQDLARVLLLEGEFERPITLLEHVVDVRSQNLPPTDLELLKSRHELARAYAKTPQGPQFECRCKDAIAILIDVAEHEQRSLAEDDSHRLSTLHGLAKTYTRMGQPKAAEPILLEILSIQNSVMDLPHPTRLATLHELGRVYRISGEADKAVEALKEVVQYRQRQIAGSPGHGALLPSQHELAEALFVAGDVEQARELAEHVYRQRQKLPQGHPDILASEEFLLKFA